jgi:hypothetical protein
VNVALEASAVLHRAAQVNPALGHRSAGFAVNNILGFLERAEAVQPSARVGRLIRFLRSACLRANAAAVISEFAHDLPGLPVRIREAGQRTVRAHV